MDGLALIGCAAALGSAAAWAVGSILFRRIGDDASPLGMNLGKGLIGLVLLGAALLIAGVEPMSARSALFLGVSGILGIALGDTFFFMALVRLDPRLTLLLGTVGQVFTVVLAMALLGERPAPLAWAGIAAVLGGVTWVLFERLPDDDEGGGRRRRLRGIAWGLLAAVCMSAGIVAAKIGVEEVSALQATWVRLAWGMAGLALWGLIARRLGAWLAPFADLSLLRRVLVAVVVIIFGGFWLSLVALKYVDASIATILNSTEPLFVLPLVALVRKERVTARAVIGALLAVGGVGLILASFAAS